MLSSEKIIAGLIIAGRLRNKGLSLNGIPGFFKLKGYWCFYIDSGMVIPTRNIEGDIVCLQVRKDSGKQRYMTLSSKGLPEGVTTKISRVHFPLNNKQVAPKSVIVTEGPLKADVASHLLNKKDVIFLALQGINSQAELNEIFPRLKEQGINILNVAFDMDRTTNINVLKGTDKLIALAKKNEFKIQKMYWDTEFAREKLLELILIGAEKDVITPNKILRVSSEGEMFLKVSKKGVFIYLEKVTRLFAEKNIAHSIIDGKKFYWKNETKGIDDFLLQKQKKAQASVFRLE